jgi:hypothetical protein
LIARRAALGIGAAVCVIAAAVLCASLQNTATQMPATDANKQTPQGLLTDEEAGAPMRAQASATTEQFMDIIRTGDYDRANRFMYLPYDAGAGYERESQHWLRVHSKPLIGWKSFKIVSINPPVPRGGGFIISGTVVDARGRRLHILYQLVIKGNGFAVGKFGVT